MMKLEDEYRGALKGLSVRPICIHWRSGRGLSKRGPVVARRWVPTSGRYVSSGREEETEQRKGWRVMRDERSGQCRH